MLKKCFILLFITSAYCAQAQISASLMQHPDVSSSQITFVYGDDVWIASKSGGLAHRLSSPAGAESYPRFSPDGSKIAYSANYEGNTDIYVIGANGGVPKRLTYHGMSDKVLGWTPDGKSVIFASSRESGRQRFSQFYTVPSTGGEVSKLPVPYGEYGSMSMDGKKFAYTDRSRVNRNWKRYRGGTAPDIHIFDLTSFETTNITNNTANDELPMFYKDAVFYMSDDGPNKRNNLWKYDLSAKTNTQLTQFKNYDITFPEGGPVDIVFEAGGKLYLYNIISQKQSEVKISVISDQIGLISKSKPVKSYIQSATISPDGNRVVVQARGELFNLPATEGFVTNLTNTSGQAERKPEWSPNGKYLAYWSDASGEYQLMIKDMQEMSAPRTVTNFKSGFNYSIFWSPDNKSVAYVDQSMKINIIDIESGNVSNIDQGKYLLEGGLRNFTASWSPDSRYVTYSRATESQTANAIFIYDTKNSKRTQLTSGYYSDSNPVFSKDGKYLFYATNRIFSPVYSDVDNTFIYPNTTALVVGTLVKSQKSLLDIKNDTTAIVIEEEVKDDKKEEEKADEEEKEVAEEEDDKEEETLEIDYDGFEHRVEMLKVKPGNIGNIAVVEGKVIFVRYPNSGAGDGGPSLDFYDITEKEVKTIISGVGNYALTADGKKLLVGQAGKQAVINVAADQKIDKTVPLDKMVMNVIPKEEWKQIFNDVWRFERDYFYDPNMHGVDWKEMRSRYGQLVDQANSRNDVNIIIGDLIAELNASHTYNGGGDVESADRKNVGYLGADVVVENGFFRIKSIINGAAWDIEVRSPLMKPGVDISEGDYIFAVNGTSLDISKPFLAGLQGMAGETIQLTTSDSAGVENATHSLVQPLSSETRLRHLAWIEANRKRVDEASNGKIGYVYVRSTGIDGQNELIRQFYGQMHKEGLIIDERFNSGGQIPDRFVELLDRDPLAFFAVRDGVDWDWPPAGNFGTKVMLINGFSGSGGDAFPDYFRKRGLGPLIGTRTWGGLIGISGAPALVDNGSVTIPTFRMYDPNGEWFKEGHGVDPDIEVIEDFQKLAKGVDVQLEAGITEALRLLKERKQNPKPPRPSYESRTK